MSSLPTRAPRRRVSPPCGGLNLLDTAPSASVDRITRLAAAAVDVPTVLPPGYADRATKNITARIGVALCTGGTECRRPYARAEGALLTAKLKGRGQVAPERSAA